MTAPWQPSSTPAAPSRLASTPVVAVLAFVVLTVVAAVVLLASVYRVLVIPSASMSPTLVPGSRIAVARHDRTPVDGDLVVFEGFADAQGGEYIRRVIGVEGDTVACCAAGSVSRNGTALEEPYTAGTPEMPFRATKVPTGRLWVMGDARDNAVDSRMFATNLLDGTVPIASLHGVVRFKGTSGFVYGQVVLRAAGIGAAGAALVALTLTAVRRRRRPRTT